MLKRYKFYQTQITPAGHFTAILRIDTPRFEKASSPFRLTIGSSGIAINGEYGANPSKEEMRETLELMREAVAAWDRKYGT